MALSDRTAQLAQLALVDLKDLLVRLGPVDLPVLRHLLDPPLLHHPLVPLVPRPTSLIPPARVVLVAPSDPLDLKDLPALLLLLAPKDPKDLLAPPDRVARPALLDLRDRAAPSDRLLVPTDLRDLSAR